MTELNAELARPSPAGERAGGAGVLLVAGVLGVLIGLAPIADVLGWATLLCAAAGLALVAWRTPEARGPLVLAFLLRAGCTLVQSYVMALPASDMDAQRFESAAWAWGSGGLEGLTEHFTMGAFLYSWLIAVLYAVTDRSALMIQALNVLLGTLVVYNVFALARMLWGVEAARRAAWLMAAFPTSVLFSALILREQVVVYPLTLGVLLFVRWYATDRLKYLAGALLAFCVAIAFHVFVISLFGAAVVVVLRRWLSTLAGRRRGNLFSASLGFVVVVGLVGVVVVSGLASINILRYASLDAFRVQTEISSAARAGYLSGLAVNSPVDIVWQAPIRMLFFLLMPFPWMISSVFDVVGVVDAGLYFLLLCFLVRGARMIRRDGRARVSLFLAFAAVLIFSLAVSNYGTAIRHRAKLAPIIAAVAACGMVRRPPAVEGGAEAERPAPAAG